MQMRINNSFKHRSIGILQQMVLLFVLQVVFNLNGLYSKDQKSVDRLPDVSIHFEFDKRLEARPYRVFLVRDKEFYKIIREWKDPNLFQFFQPGKIVYDFYNIQPGLYWVGFSFRYLQKDWSVIEWEYWDPGISTGIGKETQNRIEVRKNKRILVDLIIQLRFTERPDENDESDEYFRYVPRSRPKSPEEETMMDENYFPSGAAVFLSVKRSCSKDIVHSEIEFLIHGFDDHPFEDSNPKENK